MSFIAEYAQWFMEFTKANPVVGGVIGVWFAASLSVLARYIPVIIKAITLKQFVMSVVLHSDDALFHNFIDWHEQMGLSKKARTLRAIERNYRPRISIGYGDHYFWHKWRLYKVTRKQEESQMSLIKETIRISTLGRSQEPIRDMLNQCVPTMRDDVTRIFCWDNYWCRICEQSSRSLDTVFIPSYKKKALLDVIENFTRSRAFYKRSGIPYRMGLAFHGAPGTGKTTMVRALCHYLKRDLYIVDLAKMDNDKLMSALINVPERAVVLIEDIDTYDHCAKRTPSRDRPQLPGGDSGMVKALKELSGMTLSGMLNAIDGAISTDDRILVVTTNCFDKLDAALKRKGRIDHDVEFGYMDHQSFLDMMARVYPDFEIPTDLKLEAKVTPVDVQGLVLAYQNDPEIVVRQLCSKRRDGRVKS